ncbi:MAG: amidohydrolase family protein [Pseudomonadota bacterium]
MKASPALSRMCLALSLLVGGGASAQDEPNGWQPDIQSWVVAQPAQPDHVLIQNATVWTADEPGILSDADVLIRNGEIAAIGSDLSIPRGAIVINAEGKHVTPGIIDAHSHAAIVGGVNEATDISTAHVRIEDVIDANSINIYRQLAGGVTTINLLHGSANAIGGQMAVIKLRWGAAPDQLIFEQAPAGIKFALGENPKQSNWNNEVPRYPQTRSGVAQIIREKFQAAEDYQRARDRAPTGRTARNQVPFKVDFELEAIAEILNAERWIHSHAYRADEMVMLIELAESFGVTIGTFQHVLEGYKLAQRMADHGAGGSTFIDWWNFKYEATDAIGFNPALMHQAGVVTGLHSDNPELARRMNLEAAKAVRYGNVDPHEALMMITAGPARQLGIHEYTGSLAEGLHADLVIWNGHPLSVYSRVDQTWVDGRKYFDREADLAARERLESERQTLMAMVLDSGDESESAAGEADQDSLGAMLLGYSQWELDHDEFCTAHVHNHRHGMNFVKGNYQ